MISRSPSTPLVFRLMLRELREGLSGFRIFLACLILGIAAIAGVGSLSAALLAGMADQGRVLLAGDAEIRSQHQDFTAEQQEWIKAQGQISRAVRGRTNAFAPATDQRTLVEFRAVDDSYPHYGALETSPQMDHQGLFAPRDGQWGIAVDETLATRLDLDLGGIIRLGSVDFELRAFITNEPDRANFGFELGPAAIFDLGALPQTGLIQPGSLVTYVYKLRMAPEIDIKAWEKEARSLHEGAGWRIRTRDNSAPNIRRVIDQMGSFLTLVGLTALLVGGVGVGNAVRAYLDRKSDTIATLKVLGATGWMIFAIYLVQVMALASIAVLAGLAIGAGLPFLLQDFISDRLPVPPLFGFYAAPLFSAVIYGYLITFAFAIWPLGRARDIPAQRLFRTMVADQASRLRPVYLLMLGVSIVLIIAAGMLFSEERLLAGGFILAAGVSLLVLRGAGALVARLAALVPRVHSPGLRLAIANLHRPGAATGPVVVSLGLGLTLFVMMALVEGNMTREVNGQIPQNAPAFFFVDIQPWQYDDFVLAARDIPGVDGLETVPSLRGTITKINETPAEDWDVSKGSGWVLRGDRSLSYAVQLPEENSVVAGDWWAADYQGPPLISFSAEEARDLGIGVGDRMTLSILGREIEAEIASLRELEWGSLQFNFVILFDPHTLKSAPHSYMATLEAPGEAEALAYRRLTDQFPNVTAVRIKDVLQSVSDILGTVAAAVRAMAAVTIFAGILVLAGAMAAGYRNRVYDSVVMKVLGATRPNILRAYILEYILLGSVTALVALLLGGLGGYLVIAYVLKINFVLMLWPMVIIAVFSMAITVIFGLFSTWSALSVRPARLLRAA
ncbi:MULTISPECIES: FtsX-like permease family protein [unclassified Iodidimonas]|jgi:putative ABC transport system permease protein|uniref:ABC transporter permease n=1 Tax=unclassified Iodidimonas TaxID=2626145 RepID=UPI002482E1B3|nr:MULTISPECIES: FtsX-like permease family protein [unclassified Iodidimonas]